MTKPNYIHPKEIDKAREALWREHQGTNAVSASLCNLVIYSKKNSRETYLQKLARNIIRKFPCRMVMISEAVDNKESYLKTFVSDLKPDNGNSSLYCDMINFEVSGAHRERIPFVVFPNLLADLPIFLLWGDDPSKNDPIATQLENFATRTVFDSEAAESMTDFAKTLLKSNETIASDIGDLNWARLSPWRALFAHTFNTPNKFKSIHEAKEIRIVYNVMETDQFCHHKIQATYFQAWIATKLGWEFESSLGLKEELCFKYKSQFGPVTITLIPGKNDQVLPGRILKLEIFSYHNEHMSFEKNKLNPQQLVIRHSTYQHCEMPAYYLLDKEIAGKSMIQEIYSQGVQSSFLDVLKLVAQYQQGMI